MKHTLTSKAAELMRKNGRHRRWRRAFSGMAAVVVFITTYMLILPAITMENQAICGMAEHTHTDACYEMQLVCTQEETPEGTDVHVHGPECYEQQQVLTCTKQEGEGHVHSDACYGYVCGQEESAGHTHTDACYTEVTHRELTCTEPESAGHTHGDGCYDADGNLVCTEAESTGHTHGDSCYTETVTRELTCGQEESSGHTHTDACIGLICGQEEYEGHTHTDACYTTEDVLVCTQPTGHTHGDGCYEKVLVCDVPEHTHTEECYPAAEPEEPQEPELICTLPEHSHEDACYDADGNLICGMEEHTHTEECYAPVEIPEEETPTTAFPEEIPEGYKEYTFDNEAGLTVTAYAPKDAFDGKTVELVAEVLPEDSEEYAKAQENLDNAENAPEYDGMVAMDIRFVDADGNEVEPDASMGQVFVKIDAKALLPEDVDESTLAVQHHAKVSDGGIFGTGILEHTDVVVETVADNTEETGDITATPGETALPETLPALADEPETEEAATLEEPAAETETQLVAMNVEAEFAVNSFSTFTITWDYLGWENSVYITVEDADGTPIGSDNEIPLRSGNPIIFASSTKIPVIDGYTYALAYMQPNGEGMSSRKIIYGLKAECGWSGWTTQYGTYDAYGRLVWENFDASDYSIHLVYTPKSELKTTRGVDLPAVHVNLYNYERYWNNDGREYSGINYYQNYYERPFKFGSYGDYGSGINAWTGYDQGVYQGIVGDTLDNSKSPVLSGGNTSLDYLFNSSTPGVTKAVTDANFLFQVDSEGYYYYDSAQNFAKLDSDNDFTLYTVPRADASVAPPSEPQFLPFNDIVNDIQTGINTYDNAKNNPNYGAIYTYYSLGENVSADYLFGMTIEFDFNYLPGGKIDEDAMEFQFEGDDDVWVFIDDKLVLDLGGIHDSYSGTINFATGEVTVEKVYTSGGVQSSPKQDSLWDCLGVDSWDNYSSHTLKFFYFERGQGGSNCSIRFNLPPIPNNSLNVVKDVTTDDENALTLLGDFAYQFQVVDGSGNLLVNEGDPYEIYEGAAKVESGTVGANGIFTLQDGQRAVFTKNKDGSAYTWLAANSPQKYYVRELLEDGYVAQYGDIQYTIAGTGGGTGTIEGSELTGDLEKFTGYQSDALKGNDGSGYVVFTNQISTQNLSKLYIEKELTPGTNDTGETFNMYVTINGVPLPEGTQYTIVGSGKPSAVITTGSIPLKAGETALLLNGNKNGIVAGTVYTVVEQGADNYTVSYSAEERHKLNPSETSSEWSGWAPVALTQLGEGGVQGTVVNVASETKVTVTNSDYDKAATLDILKYLEGADDQSHTFKFQVQEVEYNSETDTYTPKSDGRNDDIQITGMFAENTPQTATVYFGYKSTVKGTFYYEISEKTGTESGVSYDTTKYIIRAVVENGTATLTQVSPAPANNGISTMSVETTDSRIDLPFTNSLTGSVSISKVVARTDSQKAAGTGFSFTVDLKNSGFNETVTATVKTMAVDATTGAPVLADRNYTYTGGTTTKEVKFDKGIAIITLNHGETIVIPGLPAANSAEITETTTAGYSTKWTGDTYPDRNEVVGATVTTAQISTNPAVTCTNTTGAVLPSTGGMGTTPFLALGTLLTLGAGMLLVQRRRKEGSDAV